jgi:O-antigen ligase
MNTTKKKSHLPVFSRTASAKSPSNFWYDKAVRVCLYAIAAAVPAMFNPFFVAVFSFPKLLTLALLTAAALLFWGYKIFIEREIELVKSPFNWLLLVFGCVCLLNTLFSVAPFTSIYGDETRFIGILTMLDLLAIAFIAFQFFRSAESVITMARVSIASATVLALYGILQYFGLFDPWLKWNVSASDRVFGTIGQGNHFGAYLGMNILLGVFFFPYVRKNIWRFLLGASLCLYTIVIFLTGSRGALLATALSLLGCGLIVIIKQKKQISSAVKKAPLLVVFILVGLLIAMVVFGGEIKKSPLVTRTVSTIQFISQGNMPDRLSWWLSTLAMIEQKPLLGYGLSTYRDVYNAFRRADYRTPEPGDMQDLITPEAAHNEYLNIAATQGLIGLGAFLALVLFVVWALARETVLAKNPDQPIWLALGIKGALFVYLIQVFFSFGVITTLTYFYLFLGLGAALAGLMRSNYAPQLRIFRLNVSARLITVLLIFALCCGIVYIVVGAALGEYYFSKANIEGSAGDLRGAIADYQRALFFRPQEYAYYQAFGGFALKHYNAPGLNAEANLKMLLLAEAEYENAIGINPYHPSLYYNLALARLQIYKISQNYRYFQSALANFDTAVKLAVNNPLYPYQSGKALMTLVNSVDKVNDDLGNNSVSGKPNPTVAQTALSKAAHYFDTALLIRPDYRDAEQLARICHQT